MGDYYWAGVVSNTWGDTDNWFSDVDMTSPVFGVPSTNDNAYYTTAYAGAGVLSYGTIDIGNGVCSILVQVQSGGAINSGTFNASVVNSGNIYGGTFNSGLDNYAAIADCTVVYNADFVFTNYGTVASMTCSADVINSSGSISGGTFTGLLGVNNGSIYGGLFTADGGTNGGSGTIYGGTFSGDGFGNSGTINDGTFTGDDFVNKAAIDGGLFSGDGFLNDVSGGAISGGTYSGDNFQNASGFGGTAVCHSNTFYDHNTTTAQGGAVTGGSFTCRVWNSAGGTITNSTGTPHYSPTGHVGYVDLIIDGVCTFSVGDLQADPGFISAGGTYNPTVIVDDLPTGGSDILGAGLL